MAKQMKENVPYCVPCDKEMHEVLLPKYEYEEGMVLHNVLSYRCNACGHVFFTEKQARDMKSRTHDLKEYTFGFERKVILSGKSLVVSIPHELADHLSIRQGQKLKIYPVANEGLLVRKV